MRFLKLRLTKGVIYAILLSSPFKSCNASLATPEPSNAELIPTDPVPEDYYENGSEDNDYDPYESDEESSIFDLASPAPFPLPLKELRICGACGKLSHLSKRHPTEKRYILGSI
ncbi:hypothetical protein EDD21DRAFT_357505 [Dissophora ornata]|nr:hypothetical protein EDD21DRAFT_357505 [Dissophora ornata]